MQVLTASNLFNAINIEEINKGDEGADESRYQLINFLNDSFRNQM
jgi:hypothetical protein